MKKQLAFKKRIMKNLYLVLALLLILCIAPMPYGFYQLVRFVAMIMFAIMAYNYWTKDSNSIAIICVALALLFQPFIKVSLGRTIWNIVDIIVGIGLAILFFYETNPNKGIQKS